MKNIITTGAVVFLLAAGMAHSAEPLPHEKTFRNLSVSVPKLSKAPTLDGTVDPAEWAGAGMAPRMVMFEREDRLLDEQGKFYFGYTDTDFWVAWQIQRPKEAIAPKAVVTKSDQGFWQTDDGIELMLNCTPAGKDRKDGRDYYMIWNALGTKYDRRQPISGPVDVKWNGDWKAVSRTVPGFGWEGEARFPLAMLEGAEKPGPGVRWRFQLCENRATPEAIIGLLGFQLNWGQIRDYPTLLFSGDDGVFVRVLDSGAMADTGKGGLILELVNPASAARTVLPTLKFYQRKPNASSTIPYLRAFDQVRDRPEDLAGQGKVAQMISDDKVSQRLLDDNYTLVKEQKEPVTLVPGERKKIDFTIAKQPGDYLVLYDVRYAGQTPKDQNLIIAGAPLPFIVPEPLAVTTRNFFLVDKSIEVRADLRYVDGWDAKSKLIVSFASPDAPDRILFEKQWSGAEAQGRVEFDLPIKETLPGKYQLHLVASDANGKKLAEHHAPITIPETPEWYAKPAGQTPVIPPPWIPIRVTDRKLSFLMGEYNLKDSVLPSAIQVRSVFDEKREPILRGPIRLHGVVDGKPVEWNGEVKIDHKSAESVRASSTASDGNVAVNATSEFEYDGMEKITLMVSSTAGKPSISELRLSIPFAKGFADLYRPGHALFHPNKVEIATGTLPSEGVAHDWRPSVWIGNSRRGLEWFAENWRGWRIGKDFVAKTIEVENSPDGATLHVYFVRTDPSKPLMLDKPREIIFGLMFTPPKTINPEAIRIGYGTYYKERQKEFPVDVAAGMNASEFWYYGDHEPGGMQGWPEQRPERSAEYAPALKGLHEHGVKVLAYSGWGISRSARVFPTWGAEMIVDPESDIGCGCNANCWNTPSADAYLWEMRHTSRDLGYDGFRMDRGFGLSQCSSLKHRGYGSVCGWVDDDGKVQPSVAIFASRKTAQRAYRMYHGPEITTNGMCIQAQHGGVRFAAILSHLDAGLTSEGQEMKARTIKELELGFWRAQYMEDKMGGQMIYGPKGNTLGNDVRLAVGAIHRLTPRSIGLVELQDPSYSRSARPAMLVAQAEDWVGWLEPGTEFYGYWENSEFLKTGQPEVYGSFHVRRGEKLLLALLNRDMTPVTATIRLNLKTLGFGEKVYAQDAVLNEPIEIKDGAMALDLTAEGFRLVKVASKPFDAEPKKIGENLIPEFEPSKWPAQGLPTGWKSDKSAAAFSVVNGEIVIRCKADESAEASHMVPLVAGKHYMLEAEVRIDSDNGAHLGPTADGDTFGVIFGGYYNPKRTMGSQTPSGHYETIRIYGSPKENSQAYVRTWLTGNGKASIRKIGVYEVDRAKPTFATAKTKGK